MVERVAVNPEVVEWAAAAASAADVRLERFTRLAAWIGGDLDPTLGQLQDFATATHVPLGYFFLERVPETLLPVADFRRRTGPAQEPSTELLDTIAMCADRQDWFSTYLARLGREVLGFVGSTTLDTDPGDAAASISGAVGYDPSSPYPTQQDALRHMVDAVESSGIMVMINSLVGNNTHRRLDVDEFQGLTLLDDRAPLVFVNGSDTKNAQVFTLFHEVAHVFLGVQGLSAATGYLDDEPSGGAEVEHWCNAVAGRVLVPRSALPGRVTPSTLLEESQSLARRLHVSTLVILRRLHDEGLVSWASFQEAYTVEAARLRAVTLRLRDEEKASGGNPYHVWPYRVGRRFARAVITDAREGGTLYRDAYRLLSTRSTRAFDGLASHLEAV